MKATFNLNWTAWIVGIMAISLVFPSCFEEKKWVDLPLFDQDINQSEAAAADRAIELLLGQDNIQMVFCRRGQVYEAHSREGTVYWQRLRSAKGYSYEVVQLEGINPLERQDPKALLDVESELAAGDNPMQTDYSEQDDGYSGPDDPRMSFLKEENVTYPLAYERISALFDSKFAPDLLVEFTPWGWYPLGNSPNGASRVGAHGFLNVVSSKVPIVFAGMGAHQGKVIEDWTRSVNIAPTVAKAIGVKKTFGVDETGRYSHEVYLKWQDGHVLDEVLDGQTPTHVVIITNDALLNSVFTKHLSNDWKVSVRQDPKDPQSPLEQVELSTYRWLVENGTLYRHGAIVNFPSNTMASHNTIGTGAYSGHHGVIDNWLYDRQEKKRLDPISKDLFRLDQLVDDQVESLYEAIHRSFDNWHPQEYPLGNFSASFAPSTNGADYILFGTMQPMDWAQCQEPDGLPYPELDETISKRTQGVDDFSIDSFYKAYLGTHKDGRRCAQLPRYSYINLTLSDDVMHENGPHSDGMNRVMVQADQRQQIIFDTLKQAGVFDTTLFVFTSDHGQCLQDVNRHKDFKSVLDQAGIRYVVTNTFIYLLTFDVELSTTDFKQGQATRLELVVRDDDTREPIEGAVVSVESGTVFEEVKTDFDGRASVGFTPAADSTRIRISDNEHTDFEKTY